jgi:hypothetical protein
MEATDMDSFEVPKRPKWMTHDAVVTIEPSRTRLLRGLYLSSILYGVLYDREVAGSADAMKVLVRERSTGKVAYSAGPYRSADADLAACEVHRVICLFGLKDFLGEIRPDEGLFRHIGASADRQNRR